MIHPLAHVENATIGKGTRVWQFASIIRNAKVGEDCTIASGVLVDAATIGDRCIVSHGAAIEPGVLIGDDVFIGPGVIFCNDYWPRVSKDGFDMALILNGEIIVTAVEDGASVGAGVVILPGVTIGAGAMIAAGSVVHRDVPACHLHKRGGSIVPIDQTRPVRRVRAAHSLLPVGC